MALIFENVTDGETVHQVGEHPASWFTPASILIWLHMTAMHHHQGHLHGFQRRLRDVCHCEHRG